MKTNLYKQIKRKRIEIQQYAESLPEYASFLQENILYGLDDGAYGETLDTLEKKYPKLLQLRTRLKKLNNIFLKGGK